jgi:hypothetical protein
MVRVRAVKDDLKLGVKAGLVRKPPKFANADVLTFDFFKQDFNGTANTAFTRTLDPKWFQKVP